MKITLLGHAGLEVKTRAGATVLCNPWLSPEGAFQGAWFPFPDNAHLRDEERFRPDAVVITHHHPDHADPWFLERLAPEVPVCIPRQSSVRLREAILRHGARPVVEAGEWEEVTVAPGVTAFFVAEPGLGDRAAVVVRADGRTLLDMSGARLFPMQLREIRHVVGGEVDVMTFQSAAVSPYPLVYGYDEVRAAKIGRVERLNRFIHLQKAMKTVQPAVGIPFAGPPAFLDPGLSALNAQQEGDGILPDPQQVADWLAKRGITSTAVLLPGDTWDAETAEKTADPRWDGFSFAERRDYLRDYAQRRRADVDAVLARFAAPAQPLEAPFRAYMQELLSMSPYFNGRINLRVGFEVTGPGGGAWAVDFRPGQEGVYDGLEECGYRYAFESRWLAAILDGRMGWEDLFLSLRLSARRDPDHPNEQLATLLRLADRGALRAAEAYLATPASERRITIHSEGKVYSVSRYCPHAGSDLLEMGEVVPGGTLRCLHHFYDFDLASGACDASSCAPLRVDVVGTAA